ncbi:hypothetical protein ABE869_12670 [Enterococcus gilvus]|uniref:hypothetical protein n=2 Tax=Enterococcus gilvus TaxID=160453 RepID=UPI003D6B3193
MSTREQAILFWFGAIILLSIVYGLKNKNLEIIKSILNLVRCVWTVLVNPISLIVILTNSIYIALFYYMNYKKNMSISLWYIKDYSIVLFFSIYPIMEYLKKIDFRKLIREKRTEFLGLAAIPLFINSTYTFSLFGEIILVFLLAFFSLIIAISEREENTKQVTKFLNYLLVILSLYMIVSSMIQFFININDVFTLDFWLSFGIEPLVWILNLPVIYLIREMVLVEKKVIFSDHKNKISSYVRFYLKLKKRKRNFKRYDNFNTGINISEYIESARELSAMGGNRIYIKLNRDILSNDILIVITSDAILGNNKYTNITNQREKYPNVVEVVNSDNKLCAFWQDDFVASQYRNDDKIEGMNHVEVIEGIKLIQ